MSPWSRDIAFVSAVAYLSSSTTQFEGYGDRIHRASRLFRYGGLDRVYALLLLSVPAQQVTSRGHRHLACICADLCDTTEAVLDLGASLYAPNRRSERDECGRRTQDDHDRNGEVTE